MKIFVPTAADCKLVTIYDSCISAFRKHNANSGVFLGSWPGAADILFCLRNGALVFGITPTFCPKIHFSGRTGIAFFTINCDDLGRGFLPGCYTSLNKANFDPQLHRACAYPYSYNEIVATSFGREKWNPKWLFFLPWDGCVSHPIRRKLFDYYSAHPRAKMVRIGTHFHGHSAEEKQKYIDEVLLSNFVLCPRGGPLPLTGLFEVMELGRCPVIISDDLIPIDGVPWQECCIFIKERDIAYCAEILTEQEAKAERLGRAAREIWESHFSEAKKFRAMLHSILELRDKRVGHSHDYRERWSSWRFQYCNQWLPHQRLAKRIDRGLETMKNSLRLGRNARS